jgi:hypothetical protein
MLRWAWDMFKLALGLVPGTLSVSLEKYISRRWRDGIFFPYAGNDTHTHPSAQFTSLVFLVRKCQSFEAVGSASGPTLPGISPPSIPTPRNVVCPWEGVREVGPIPIKAHHLRGTS